MLIFFGSQRKIARRVVVSVECPACRSSPCVLFVLERKFTLYTVPTFKIANLQILKCPGCAKEWHIDASTAHRLEEQVRDTPMPGPMPQVRDPGAATIVQSGGPSGIRCGACGRLNLADARFCDSCGAERPTSAPPVPPAPSEPSAP
jgi:hypothetical protein